MYTYNVWHFIFNDGIANRSARLGIEVEKTEEEANKEFVELSSYEVINAEIIGQI